MLKNYLMRRALLMIPTLFGISLLMFLLTGIIPGGPIDRILQDFRFSGSSSGAVHSEITEEYRKALMEEYGYDKPFYMRYLFWIGGIFQGDLGHSFEYEQPVWEVIQEKLPVSLSFGILSFILVYFLSIPLGVLKAMREGTHFDVLSSFLLFLAYSIPPFSLGIILMLYFSGGSYLSWFPLQGLTSDHFSELSWWEKLLDYAHHMCLPLIAYVVGMFALTAILMKNSFLEQKNQDYVRTARAKGLSEKMIAFRHILRGSLTPIATQLAEFPGLFLSGSLLIEQIFGLDGIGLLNYTSIIARDYPVVLAIIMIAAVAQLLGVLLSDICYALLDPRVSYAYSARS